VLCGRFWGSITLSTISEPAKTSKVYLLKMLHTTNKDEEKFLFLVEISHRKFYKKSRFRWPICYVKLAEI
jgi:hypothetical protein